MTEGSCEIYPAEFGWWRGQATEPMYDPMNYFGAQIAEVWIKNMLDDAWNKAKECRQKTTP